MKEGLQERLDSGLTYLGSRCIDDGTRERYKENNACVECHIYKMRMDGLQVRPKGQLNKISNGGHILKQSEI